MTMKERLSQYIEADRLINQKLKLRKHYEDMRLKISPSPDAPCVQHSVGNSHVESIAAKIVDLEREIDKEIDQLQEIRHKVQRLIWTLEDPKLRDLLRDRYILGHTWEDIAEGKGCTVRWANQMHKRALMVLTLKQGKSSQNFT